MCLMAGGIQWCVSDGGWYLVMCGWWWVSNGVCIMVSIQWSSLFVCCLFCLVVCLVVVGTPFGNCVTMCVCVSSLHNHHHILKWKRLPQSLLVCDIGCVSHYSSLGPIAVSASHHVYVFAHPVRSVPCLSLRIFVSNVLM